MKFEEALQRGRALRPDLREEDLFKLAHDERFPALLGVIEELREELSDSAGNYDRSEGERTMDCGGLAMLKELKGRLQGIMERPAKQEEKREAGG
jgi:hypothetical protein